MRLLLDSHVIVWWLDDPSRLTGSVRAAIQNPANGVSFSAASIWELSLKSAKNQLRLPPNLLSVLKDDGFDELPVTSAHAMLASSLPALHGDPFDRLLIAQALAEGLVLATRDRAIVRYDVPVMEA